MLNLPEVTLVTIATRDPAANLAALARCIAAVNFARVVIFTTEPATYRGVGDTVEVKPRDHHEWCVWRMTELPRHHARFAGSHILFIESDSALVNPRAWRESFLAYDYIGAPWPGGIVGNGGFTLISLRMLAAIAALKLAATQAACFPCDYAMCRASDLVPINPRKFYRPALEAAGMVYAPAGVADAFANETGGYLGAFGIHGKEFMKKFQEGTL